MIAKTHCATNSFKAGVNSVHIFGERMNDHVVLFDSHTNQIINDHCWGLEIYCI